MSQRTRHIRDTEDTSFDDVADVHNLTQNSASTREMNQESLPNFCTNLQNSLQLDNISTDISACHVGCESAAMRRNSFDVAPIGTHITLPCTSNNNLSTIRTTIVGDDHVANNPNLFSGCIASEKLDATMAEGIRVYIGCNPQRMSKTAIRIANVNLLEGNSQTNTSDVRKNGLVVASLLSKLSRQAFWILLAIVSLCILPFFVSPIILLWRKIKYGSCDKFGILPLLIAISGVLNMSIVIVYGTLVYRHQDEAIVKARGKHYLYQTFLTGPIVIFLATALSIACFTITPDYCSNSHDNVWRLSETFWFCIGFTILRFFCTVFMSGIIARQRLLYRLFVHRRGTRIYKGRVLIKQYFYTVLFFAVLYSICEIPYYIATDSVRFRWIVLISQMTLLWTQVITFTYYSYRTRNIEIMYSDWWSNVRVILLYMVTSIIVCVLFAFQGITLMLGMIFGAMSLFAITIYIMDSFTAILLKVVFGVEKLSEVVLLKYKCSTSEGSC